MRTLGVNRFLAQKLMIRELCAALQYSHTTNENTLERRADPCDLPK